MKKSDQNVYEFISSHEKSSDLSQLDSVISKVFKGEERVLWTGKFWGGSDQEIIGYGELMYERPKENIEWFKIGLAVQKNYISLYVSAVDGKKYLSETWGPELGKVKVGKSNIGFKSVDDIDLKKLEEMLEKAKTLF